MPKPSTFLFSFACLAALAAQAQDQDDVRPSAEIQLSNDTLQMRYMADGERVRVGSNSQASATFFLSEERDIVLSGDLLFPADIGFTPLDITFGPRAYAALLEDENNDVMALSLGAEVRFTLDRNSGLAIAGHAFYAPDIVTFGSADSLTDRRPTRADIAIGRRGDERGGRLTSHLTDRFPGFLAGFFAGLGTQVPQRQLI